MESFPLPHLSFSTWLQLVSLDIPLELSPPSRFILLHVGGGVKGSAGQRMLNLAVVPASAAQIRLSA
jgi:hypothetical protein